jgi:hypothetical protein
MGYERWHWSLTNIVARFVGLMFGLTSLAFTVDAARAWIDREPREGIPSDPVTAAYFSLFVGLLSGAIAFGALRVKPYRPDLGDRTFSWSRAGAKGGEQRSQRRSWWTGEPCDDS